MSEILSVSPNSTYDLTYDLEHVWRVAQCSEIVCTKFKLSQAIRSWNLNNFLTLISHVMLWFWALTHWLESLWYICCQMVIVCSKFDWNQTISGWVIDNLVNFCPHYVTLWCWPLTPWPWTCIVDRVSCGQRMYQRWARLINPRLSYWWFTTYFLSVFRGCCNTGMGVFKNV